MRKQRVKKLKAKLIAYESKKTTKQSVTKSNKPKRASTTKKDCGCGRKSK